MLEKPACSCCVDGYQIEITRDERNLSENYDTFLEDGYLTVLILNDGSNVFSPRREYFVFGIVQLKVDGDFTFNTTGSDFNDIVPISPKENLEELGIHEVMTKEYAGIWFTVGVLEHNNQIRRKGFLLKEYRTA